MVCELGGVGLGQQEALALAVRRYLNTGEHSRKGLMMILTLSAMADFLDPWVGGRCTGCPKSAERGGKTKF